MQPFKRFLDATMEHVFQEDSTLPTAMDASSGYHGPEGYPRADIPPKFLNLIATTLGKTALQKAIKSQTDWIFFVRADKFDVRSKDFKTYLSFGLSGIRFDRPNTILLYFKQ